VSSFAACATGALHLACATGALHLPMQRRCESVTSRITYGLGYVTSCRPGG